MHCTEALLSGTKAAQHCHARLHSEIESTSQTFTWQLCAYDIAVSKHVDSDGITLVGYALHTNRHNRLHTTANTACQRRFLHNSTCLRARTHQGKRDETAVLPTQPLCSTSLFLSVPCGSHNWFHGLLLWVTFITRCRFEIGWWHIVKWGLRQLLNVFTRVRCALKFLVSAQECAEAISNWLWKWDRFSWIKKHELIFFSRFFYRWSRGCCGVRKIGCWLY